MRTFSESDMLSDRINHILDGCGLKQRELADILGVPIQRVKRLAGGTVQRLTQDEWRALTTTLRISANWLITGEGAMLQEDEEGKDAQRDATGTGNHLRETGKLSTPDIVLLEQIIAAVEGHLEARRKRLKPQKKAKLIALLYEHFYGEECGIDAAYVDALVDVAA